MKILITGGAGFIGSALIRHILANTDYQVMNVDRLTYAGNLDSLPISGMTDRIPSVKLIYVILMHSMRFLLNLNRIW